MYPFGGLPENLIAFCGVLRRERRFGIGPGEARDAARALETVDLADEAVVRDALRPVLCRTAEEAAVFDRAFSEFFFPGPRGVPQPGLPPASREAQRQEGEGEQKSVRPPPEHRTGDGRADQEADAVGERAVPVAVGESDEPAPALTLARAAYSPLDAREAAEVRVLQRADAAWRDAARALVRRLQLGRTRRWRPAPAGRRFDLRRTLRGSLQTGGETVSVRWLRRPRRTPRFVLLVDGSRSMGGHAWTALQVAVALAGATLRVEAFTFSTGLQRVSDEVRRAAAGETPRLSHLERAWGGGTSIGGSLREFLRRYGERLVGRDTLVVIASDGLDLGEPDQLREAMRQLRRRAAGIVWLNPLLDTPGYEPTARGMVAARPYVTTFASLVDAAGLARLARLVVPHR